jgi:glyoxylase-like metal-dependent hydrolase (beta-lactamase superfamily II)
MRRLAFSLLGLAVLYTPPAEVRAQRSEYPLILVPTAKGPFTFPPGYQTPWDRIEITVTEKMSPNLYVLHGSPGLDAAHPDASGGRAMVLFGPDGVLLVDTQNRQVAEKTLRAIRSFTGEPIRILVNTHVHSDHTGANAFFAKQGALIVDFIPMMPSHTAGDTIVRFRKANVIYVEDFYRNFGYPFADQANGGSIAGMLEAVDLFDQVADANTTLVPGHGTMITKKDLRPYRAMLVDIMSKVKTLRAQGKSLQEVLAANLTAPYDETTLGDTQQSKDRFITEAYDEAGQLPPVVDGKRAMPVR